MSVGSYQESIARLTELYHGPIVPARQAELRRIEFLLDTLDHPEGSFRSVHVAGSTGKGSTTSMIGAIFAAAGYSTGVFRSPHLRDYTERIAIDGEDISEDAWVETFNRIWPTVVRMRDGEIPGYSLGRPSFFEVLFALACAYFRERRVEWAAMETGMGGRLDATNVLNPDVAVVTNVSLEHTQVLGSTVGEIAVEKAAIIKAGSHAVTAAEDEVALEVIRARAQEVAAPLIVVDREVRYRVEGEDVQGQDVHIESAYHGLDVHLPLAGGFQPRNAATAYGVVLALRQRAVELSDDDVRSGLGCVRVPARLERVGEKPLTLIDGAHNPAAIRELVVSVRSLVPDVKPVVLFGAMVDKDLRSMATALAPLPQALVLTAAPDTERAASAEVLAEAFAGLVDEVIPLEDARAALDMARGLAGQTGFLLITGSMYLAGFARQTLLQEVHP